MSVRLAPAWGAFRRGVIDCLRGLGPGTLPARSSLPVPLRGPQEGSKISQEPAVGKAKCRVPREDDVVKKSDGEEFSRLLQLLSHPLVLARGLHAAARVVVGHNDGRRCRLKGNRVNELWVNGGRVHAAAGNLDPPGDLVIAVQAQKHEILGELECVLVPDGSKILDDISRLANHFPGRHFRAALVDGPNLSKFRAPLKFL